MSFAVNGYKKCFIKNGKSSPLKKRKGIFLRSALRLVGQSLSALISASFQNSSARCRRHSLAETVYFTCLSLFGLIGSFHNLSPVFLLFIFSLFLRHRTCPHDNFLNYSVKPLYQSSDFTRFFVNFILLCLLIARPHGQNEILVPLALFVPDREGRYRRVEGQHDHLFFQRFQRL